MSRASLARDRRYAAATPIPQVSPGSGYLQHRTAIDAAMAAVMQSGNYVLGEQVAAFEQAFAQYLGVPHAIGVANGTDAVALALRALGVKAGDAVATVSHTAVATVAAIRMIGAIPVLIDIEADGYSMDPSHLADTLPPDACRRWSWSTCMVSLQT